MVHIPQADFCGELHDNKQISVQKTQARIYLNGLVILFVIFIEHHIEYIL